MKTIFIIILITTLTQAQWFLVDPSPTNHTLNDVQLVTSTIGYAVGNSGTILKTINGGAAWTLQVSGTTNNLYSLSFTDENTGTVVGLNGTILRTMNGGIDWIEQSSGTSGWLRCVSFVDANNGIAGGIVGIFIEDLGGIILRTTNGGENWFVNQTINVSPILALYLLDSTNMFAIESFNGPDRILKSTDRGETWILVSNYNSSMPALTDLCFTDSNYGIAVDANGLIFRTTNGGIDWIEQANKTNNWLSCVSFINENYGTVVGDSGIILMTTNGGVNWEVQVSGTNENLHSVSFLDVNNGIAVGEDGTILRTINAEAPVELTSFNSSTYGNSIQLNWQTATEINNKGFEIYRNGKMISFVNGKGTTTERQNYSFTDEGLSTGLYNYRLNQIDFDGTQKIVGELTVYLTIPEQFSLEQNYPNPFNPTTTISFSIPTSEFVTLKVYDVLGKEVATLVDEEKPAGSYEVEFNSANPNGSGQVLPSGIYLYKLQAGNFVETKKLMLLK